MNRAIRHDALLIWRETAAALSGWGDRIVVAAGLALIVAVGVSAGREMSERSVLVAALAIGGWIGFGVGRVCERHLARHRDAYLFAGDVLTGAGGWRYRASAILLPAIAIAAITVGIDGRAAIIGAVGCVLAFCAAVGVGAVTDRAPRVGRIDDRGCRRGAVVAIVLAVAISAFWWPAAPAWLAVVPTLTMAALSAPNDADAIRFEAVAGRHTGGSLRAVSPMLAGSVAIALAALCHSIDAAAISMAVGVAAAWLAALRVMAWRAGGRRSGKLIVIGIVAIGAVAGTMAFFLAPIALLIGAIWLWRRAQAATWLIA